jgi:hypothetical protein
MARPKPSTPRVLISLRVTPQFLNLMDGARGDQSRADWLEGLALMAAYRGIKQAQAHASGPTRPRSGARTIPA